MGTLTKLQRGAIYLVISIVTAVVGRLLEPTYLEGDTPGHDLVANIDVMRDNATLEQVSSLLVALALLSFIAALMVIWEHVRDDEIFGALARTGVLLAGMTSFVLAVLEGLDHIAVRALQDGIGEGADVEQVALSVLATKLGFFLFVFPVLFAGVALAALGMMRLLPGGLSRVISGVTAVASLATAVLLAFVEPHVEANDFWQGLAAGLGALLLVWAVMLAHAMYTGRLASSAS